MSGTTLVLGIHPIYFTLLIVSVIILMYPMSFSASLTFQVYFCFLFSFFFNLIGNTRFSLCPLWLISFPFYLFSHPSSVVFSFHSLHLLLLLFFQLCPLFSGSRSLSSCFVLHSSYCLIFYLPCLSLTHKTEFPPACQSTDINIP